MGKSDYDAIEAFRDVPFFGLPPPMRHGPTPHR
jgi:hypothetical protein